MKNHKHSRPKTAAILAMAFMAFILPLIASAATKTGGVYRTISVVAGKADTVTLDKPVADVLVANPAVADVGTLRANRLYVVGKAIGDTNVLAFDEEGNQLANISVRVNVDDQSLRDSIHNFFPGEAIDVKTVKGEVILKGRVSTPAVANQVRDLASRFVTAQGKTVVDLMNVEGEQQVMLKVKVVEARRNILREFGFETDVGVGGNNFINTAAGVGLQSLTQFATGQLIVAPNSNFGPIQTRLQALEKDGLINTLAEPNLTAISGETAGFLAGGEFPVPVGRDQDGNVTLEFKQFGVSLNFTPTVLSSERIALQLSTEVSSKSDDDSVTLVNTKIPGLSVRRAETTVQMGSGGTIMIAGLIKSDTLHAMNGLPGVQDVPILGQLFKSKSFTRNETELVILVTPYIVKPFAQSAAVETPAAAPPAQLLQDTKSPNAPVDYPTTVPAASPVGKVESQPVAPMPAAAAPVRQSGLPPQNAKVSGANLSAAFATNLKKTYGERGAVKASGPYGYIVD